MFFGTSWRKGFAGHQLGIRPSVHRPEHVGDRFGCHIQTVTVLVHIDARPCLTKQPTQTFKFF